MFKSQIHIIFSSRKFKFNVIPTFILHLFTCLWFDSLVFAQFEFDCDTVKKFAESLELYVYLCILVPQAHPYLFNDSIS
jgi:hypothetical protein